LEIQTSAQAGEDPDLDTTLGTLIHYGLIERISDGRGSEGPLVPGGQETKED
jgi:hypothetical protein